MIVLLVFARVTKPGFGQKARKTIEALSVNGNEVEASRRGVGWGGWGGGIFAVTSVG